MGKSQEGDRRGDKRKDRWEDRELDREREKEKKTLREARQMGRGNRHRVIHSRAWGKRRKAQGR